jgi:tRNA pseudouridine38-40 synthase
LKTWKLTLEYDGTKYSGWQEQKNARTVQGQIRKAAEDFFGTEVELRGSGRTDAGVHARAQVAHLRVRPKADSKRRNFPAIEEIRRALNDRLPADVCILEISDAAPEFHARHDATSRTYVYQISTRRTAFGKKYVWWVRERLDTAAMSRAARMLIGRHNFICFRALDPARPDESTIVVVDNAGIEIQDHLILFRITGSHFLWRMVRRVVGVLVKIGKGELSPPDFARMLEGHANPSQDIASWTAPASGLFLEKVTYPAESPQHSDQHSDPERRRRRP